MEKQKLPNATVVLILGILSIPACCFYGAGLLFGIIALVIGKKDFVTYRDNPEGYDNYGNLNTGRILAIIGIVLSVIFIAILVWTIAYFGMEVLQNPELMQEKMKKLSGE